MINYNKHIDRLKTACVSLVFALMCVSCGGTPQPEQTQLFTTSAAPETPAVTDTLSPSERTFIPDSSNVKLIGRTYSENGILWLAQSASGIEFTFRGTKASVDITGDGSVFGKSDSKARFAVYVNGERVMDEMVEESLKTYDIYTSDEPADVDVRILKLSECANSSFGIKALNVTSENGISPAPEKELKIEFIGDSITCAYGVDDEVKEHHFSTETEDATKSYAYKTAQKLGADYSLVAFSGHGIISGYTSDKKNTEQLVPTFYEKVSRSYGSASAYYDTNAEWDFDKFVPDYIVINLGTNDDSYVKGIQERKDEFSAAYAEFIGQVRKSNPDSYIICALGVMGDGLYPSVENAVSQYISDTGDNMISAFRLSVQEVFKNGAAADWHPTEATHEIAAEELSEYIESLMKGKVSEAA